MPRLKDRNRSIPNGLKFFEHETKWKAPPHLSFNALVDAVISHRRGNASLASKSTDPNIVADEVDCFNAVLCQRMGWTNYVIHDGSPELKKKQTTAPGNASAEGAPIKTMARGAVTLASILGPSEKPVAHELAEKRAAICVECPENESKKDWKSFFSEAGANTVRKLFGFLHDARLRTSKDAQLGICQACFCPLKMKVHTELKFILENTDNDTMNRFPDHCWIKLRDK
jgi:hypothetical protein